MKAKKESVYVIKRTIRSKDGIAHPVDRVSECPALQLAHSQGPHEQSDEEQQNIGQTGHLNIRDGVLIHR